MEKENLKNQLVKYWNWTRVPGNIHYIQSLLCLHAIIRNNLQTDDYDNNCMMLQDIYRL